MKKMGILLGMALLCQPVLAADDAANKKILKDALVGAVTGAVAAEATAEDAPAVKAASAVTDPAVVEKKKKSKERYEAKMKEKAEHKNKKKRPYGWDQGKKEGWGGGDEPPGLSKKDKKGKKD